MHLRHASLKAAKAVFTIRQGAGPLVVVNADAEGILRAPPPVRGDPLETGMPIEEAYPDVVVSLLSIAGDSVIDERPKPEPEEPVGPAPAPVIEAAAPPEPTPAPRRAAKATASEPAPTTDNQVPSGKEAE